MSVRRPGFQHASFHPGENKGDECLGLEQRKALLASKPSFLLLGQSTDVSSVTGSESFSTFMFILQTFSIQSAFRL